MAPTVTREYSIAYGGVTIGGTSDYYLLHADPPIRISGNYENTTVEATVIVRDDTEANFNTRCAALETAFRKPNQDLTVTLGSTTFMSLSHASNTGVLARPTFSKPGNADQDSARRRLYHVSVTVQRPADLSGKDGLRDAAIEFTVSPSGVRSYHVTGAYTALSSNGARAQYEASIATLLTAIEAVHAGVTWERSPGNPVIYDDENKVARFTRTGTELIFNQSSGVRDNTSIRNESFRLTRRVSAPGDSPTAERPQEVSVSFDADIDTTVTDLASFYISTVRPHCLQQVRSTIGGQVALVSDEPSLDYARSRISASLGFVVVTGSNVLQRETSTEDQDDEGVLSEPVWDGNPWSRVETQGPKSLVRTVIDSILRLDSGGGSGGAGGGAGNVIQAGLLGLGGGKGGAQVDGQGSIAGQTGGAFGFQGTIGNGNYLGGAQVTPPGGGGGAGAGGGGAGGRGITKGWRRVGGTLRRTPKTIGTSDASFRVVAETRVDVYIYREPAKRGAGGGSGGQVESPGGAGGQGA